MSGPTPQGRPLFALFWRLYILLGLVSACAGAFLVSSPRQFLPGAGADLMPVRIVGVILLVFGIIRIVNALVQLRRMGRS